MLLLLRSSSATSTAYDVLVVLAGGVDDQGTPHETVMRRLRRAAQMYRQAAQPPGIVCNGGGTTHKPKWTDAAGYAVPEAALMGRQLLTLGVPANDVYVEGCAHAGAISIFFKPGTRTTAVRRALSLVRAGR